MGASIPLWWDWLFPTPEPPALGLDIMSKTGRRSAGLVWGSGILGTQTPSLDPKGLGKEGPRPGGRQ